MRLHDAKNELAIEPWPNCINVNVVHCEERIKSEEKSRCECEDIQRGEYGSRIRRRAGLGAEMTRSKEHRYMRADGWMDGWIVSRMRMLHTRKREAWRRLSAECEGGAGWSGQAGRAGRGEVA